MQKSSNSGSMGKYALNNGDSFCLSDLYVIEKLQMPTYIKGSCHDTKFCKDTRHILFNDVCNSFKDETSSKAHRSTKESQLANSNQKNNTISHDLSLHRFRDLHSIPDVHSSKKSYTST